MEKKKLYKNAANFRRALEERLLQLSKTTKVDNQRLRKQAAFDRFLVRQFAEKPAPWIIKGGYAMQLRMSNARNTKDIDLAMKDAKFLSSNPDEQNEAILELLVMNAKKDQGDFFTFIIDGPVKDLDAAPYGGARFHIEARLDDRTFEKFILDVGIGDVWIEPSEELRSKDFFSFAGINAHSFPAISKEQQFAEKIHAYTLPRKEGRSNSRVKDIVDMILLISDSKMDLKKLSLAIDATFKRRCTHNFPDIILPPPVLWQTTFKPMAKSCDIKLDLDSAFKVLENFVKKIPLL